MLCLPSGVGQHFVGKRTGQIKLMNHCLRINARVAGAAQHFNNNSFAVPQMRRKTHHLDNDFVLLASPLGPGIAHRHWPRKTCAVNAHPARPSRFKKGAHKAGGAAKENLDDLTGRAWPAHVARSRNAHPHRVTRSRIERGMRCDV